MKYLKTYERHVLTSLKMSTNAINLVDNIKKWFKDNNMKVVNVSNANIKIYSINVKTDDLIKSTIKNIRNNGDRAHEKFIIHC